MTIPSTLSLVTLGVRDVAASTRFYESLGFRLSSASQSGVVSFFHTAGALLGLFGADDLAADAQLDAPRANGFSGISLAVNVASRDAVDAGIAAAAAAGAQVSKTPQETEWGGYHGYFTDPDGYAWEIAHNPFWPLGADGLPQLP